MITRLIQKSVNIFMPKVVVKRNYNNKVSKFIFLERFVLIGDDIRWLDKKIEPQASCLSALFL